MKLEDFNFQLPKELIASFPLEERSNSRLLLVKDGLQDLIFKDLPNLLRPNDVLVVNDSKVIKARLFGIRETGSKVEFLIEKILDETSCLVQTKSNSKLKKGDKIFLSPSKETLILTEQKDEVWLVNFSKSVRRIIEEFGHVPLPPYIKRKVSPLDSERYQTVYADPIKNFSVAAPTAGLHFDQQLLNLISSNGTNIVNVTLHVGMGTFKPLKGEPIKDHKMHKESIEVTEEAIEKINQARDKGGRVICVGTTTLRCLESICLENKGVLKPFKGETDIFIYPGFKFKVSDALITNFHLPKSTLLLLVSAFGGYEKIRLAYDHAIRENYRFYSYGDAMFISLSPQPIDYDF